MKRLTSFNSALIFFTLMMFGAVFFSARAAEPAPVGGFPNGRVMYFSEETKYHIGMKLEFKYDAAGDPICIMYNKSVYVWPEQPDKFIYEGIIDGKMVFSGYKEELEYGAVGGTYAYGMVGPLVIPTGRTVKKKLGYHFTLSTDFKRVHYLCEYDYLPTTEANCNTLLSIRGGGGMPAGNGGNSNDPEYLPGRSSFGRSSCRVCGGTGRCTSCNGNGSGWKQTANTSLCASCNGSGKCFNCYGSGKQ